MMKPEFYQKIQLMIGFIRKFMEESRGGIAVTFSLALIPLLGCVALAVDVSTWYAARTQMQSIADGAAIASAQELRIGRATDAQVADAARRYADSTMHFGASYARGATVDARISEKRNEVTVTLTSAISPIFSSIVTVGGFDVTVRATAKLSGTIPVCMVATDPQSASALSLGDTAELTAEGCGIYSNSSNQGGIVFTGSARVTAARICSTGGYQSNAARIKPTPEVDCPAVGDPLEHRKAPGGCSNSAASNNILKIRGNQTLNPGQFCHGIHIAGGSTVTFNSGIYVIGGAGLIVEGASKIVGKNTGIAFNGKDSTFYFGPDTSINLTAPVAGELAGILFIEDANAPLGRNFRISSNNARNLLGTIYLSRGNLIVDSETGIGEDSAYTVIVARKIKLENAPRLVLNTNYSATDVPVPEGVGLNSLVHLSQ